MKKVNTRNLLLIVGVSAYPLIATLGQESLEDRAARIHREAIVLDTHIDTTQHMIEEPTWNFFARHEPPSGLPEVRGAAEPRRSAQNAGRGLGWGFLLDLGAWDDDRPRRR